MATVTPQNVVVRGRLSFPSFTVLQALALNERGKPQYKKPVDKVRPSFSLVVEQAALDKLITHLVDVLLPWSEQQFAAKEKGGLEPKLMTKLKKIIDAGDWENDPVLGLIKPVHEKTAPLAPEGVATVKVNGYAGTDIIQKAIVRELDELQNPLDDIIIPSRGKIMPIEDTKLELYPGSIVSTEINLFPFETSGQPGITGSASTVVLVGDAERFGGGGALDEDSIFMDLED